MSHAARGARAWPRSPPATAPVMRRSSAASAAVAVGVTSKTTHVWPSRTSRSTRLAPIRPRPIMPSCIAVRPLAGSRSRAGRGCRVRTCIMARADGVACRRRRSANLPCVAAGALRSSSDEPDRCARVATPLVGGPATGRRRPAVTADRPAAPYGPGRASRSSIWSPRSSTVFVGDPAAVRVAVERVPGRRPRAARGHPRRRQDPAGQGAGRAASAAPSAGSRAPPTCCPSDLTGVSVYDERTRAVGVPARARCSTTSSWSTSSTGRRPAPSRRCSRRWPSARSPSTAPPTPSPTRSS